MRSRILSLSLIWLLLIGGYGRAQEAKPTEYQIKAAFLFNFAKFVQWPKTAFETAKAPIVIGILGDNPFHDDLARMTQNKTVDAHPVVVRELHQAAEAAKCHILFISASEKKQLPGIIKSLQGMSVLTVGDMDDFTDSGGMINFILTSAKVRFEINNEAATSAGLRISSKLLALAIRPKR